MLLKKWEELPEILKNNTVRKYYNILYKKKYSLYLKRLFDIAFSLILLIILSPLYLIITIAIKIDSPGRVFFRQIRVTQYGRMFRIFKFRTMVSNAEKIGAQITIDNDSRVTRIGRIVRKLRFDEISQLIDVLRGTMTFVGTRPEVVEFVTHYTDEMLATLLLPAGVTSEASIYFKDEDSYMTDIDNAKEIYINQILPMKMKYNINYIKSYSFLIDIKIIFLTIKNLFINGKVIKNDFRN